MFTPRIVQRQSRAATIVAALLFVGTAAVAQAQVVARTMQQADSTDPLAKALAAEDKHDIKTAAINYRIVLQRALSPNVMDGDAASMALLGLERVWTEGGMQDSIMVVVERVLTVRRGDPIARGIQLRSLLTTGNEDGARFAFNEWRRSVPTEAGPYREYARLLMQTGRAKSADTILTEATRQLGNARDFSGEVAQLNVALERWGDAARAFKAAMTEQPWLENSGVYSLQRVPIEMRDTVRNVLSSAPIKLGARRMLAELELNWGEPRRAWTSLSGVPVDDSTLAAWKNFGEQVETSSAWQVSRDAWTAVMDKTGDLTAVQRAAHAATQSNDPKGALDIIARGSANKPPANVAKILLREEVAALSELGRPADAQKRIDDSKAFIDDGMRQDLLRPMVGAWLRTGNLEQARAAAAAADLEDDDETAGWIALYSGDLANARKRLVRVDARRGEQIQALSLLSRTRTVTSPALGRAFLSIAQRDTAKAVAQFVALADSMSDAAPALLAMAARLEESRGGSPAQARALVLWKRIRTDFPKSAEGPEAAYAWAQSLDRSGDTKGAIEQMETMLIDYSDSAIAPQARRELERLRAKRPPGEV
ncbi:MAG: hypothetical protein ACO1Q7_16530 [Gemmatimonas sp.]